jgi:hypothetical protein
MKSPQTTEERRKAPKISPKKNSHLRERRGKIHGRKGAFLPLRESILIGNSVRKEEPAQSVD